MSGNFNIARWRSEDDAIMQNRSGDAAMQRLTAARVSFYGLDRLPNVKWRGKRVVEVGGGPGILGFVLLQAYAIDS